MTIFGSESHAIRRIRGAQAVTAALALGLAAFAAVAMTELFSRQAQRQPPQQPAPSNMPLISALGVVFTVIVLGAREVVTPQIIRQGRRRIAQGTHQPASRWDQRMQLPASATDADRFLALFMARHVIRAAMAEGPAFFALIAYIVERQWWILFVPFLSLALIAMEFPTRNRVEGWITHQLELLSLER